MKSHSIPERFQCIIDRVMEHDRKWFLAHPEHDRFVRDMVSGEFGPHDPDGNLTFVINFLGHVRWRMPIAELAPSTNEFVTLIEPSGKRVYVPLVRL